MIYSYDYSSDYSPSMPILEVILENYETGTKGKQLTAIIDSGADSCIFPLNFLNAIGSKSIRRTNMVGVTGVRIPVETHMISLHVGGMTVHAIEAIADKNNRDAIIGRNVLNQLIVTLNGLASVTEISE